MLHTLLFTLILIFPFQSAFAQSLKKINHTIVAKYTLIEKLFQSSTYLSGPDSLFGANSQLLAYLVSKLSKEPKTLSFKFKLPNGIWTASSPDGALRIWSWDTWTGGSMAHCNSLAQYRTSHGVRTQLLGDTASTGGNCCWEIYSVKRENGEMVYLPVMRGKYSNKDAAQTILAYVIRGDSLLHTKKLFVVKNKAFDSIEIGYDYFTNMLPNSRDIHVRDKKLFVPLVEGDSVTERWLQYTFDGKAFVYKGTIKAQPR
jgi:hypothetical protein